MEKTLSQLAKEVYNARSIPGILAPLHIELATEYTNISEEMALIKIERAIYCSIKTIDENGQKREKPLSDNQVENMWTQTESGQQDMKYEYALKSLDRLMQACRTSMVDATIQAKNI